MGEVRGRRRGRGGEEERGRAFRGRELASQVLGVVCRLKRLVGLWGQPYCLLFKVRGAVRVCTAISKPAARTVIGHELAQTARRGVEGTTVEKVLGSCL